jgi:hypothetical protein
MLKWLRRKWHARQRAADIRILWPSICAMRPVEEQARNAMLLHSLLDPAWEDVPNEERRRILEALPYPPEAQT